MSRNSASIMESSAPSATRSSAGSSSDITFFVPVEAVGAQNQSLPDYKVALIQYGQANHNRLVAGSHLVSAYQDVLVKGRQYLSLTTERDRQLGLFLAVREDYRQRGLDDVVVYMDANKERLEAHAAKEIRIP
ncbi:hypothetical protein BKA70DRAFT_1225577 [Coprinopsis sp. MPI-PUGE-AT-0042]|nr:hypothetical protein BKA70DRAFT_1225577 [Coprinopsis sp. MPI-PUGE-AT-0042]